MNQFWQLVGTAIGEDLKSLDRDQRIARLRERRIALWDVVSQARRAGSLDINLKPELLADVSSLISTLPDLRAIAFNGAKAAQLGLKLKIPADMDLLNLPSSSPANTMVLAAKQDSWNAIARYL